MAADPRVIDLVLRWEELHAAGHSVPAEELCRDCPDLLPAMRLVEGQPLKDAIERYHEAGRADPAGRNLALRRLLGRFVAVCKAVAYAHGQGVVHLDLKPGNILLGDFDETLVVDWGLARRT